MLVLIMPTHLVHLICPPLFFQLFGEVYLTDLLPHCSQLTLKLGILTVQLIIELPFLVEHLLELHHVLLQ